MEKRNSPGYSIDGNNGGSNRQNLYLWSSSNGNVNQQWNFETVSSGGARIADEVAVSKESRISVYPNPSTGVINISMGSDVSDLEVKLLDINGQSVYQEHFNQGDVTFQVEGNTGVYILQITSEAGNHMQRILIQ